MSSQSQLRCRKASAIWPIEVSSECVEAGSCNGSEQQSKVRKPVKSVTLREEVASCMELMPFQTLARSASVGRPGDDRALGEIHLEMCPPMATPPHAVTAVTRAQIVAIRKTVTDHIDNVRRSINQREKFLVKVMKCGEPCIDKNLSIQNSMIIHMRGDLCAFQHTWDSFSEILENAI
jgi:hypothetical protein